MQFEIASKTTVDMSIEEALEMIKQLTISVQAAMKHSSDQQTFAAIASKGEQNFPGTITMRVSRE